MHGVARHLPRVVDGNALAMRAPQRAEVLHPRAVPEEGVLVASPAVEAWPVTCPEALMARPSLYVPPSVPRSCILVPSQRKA